MLGLHGQVAGALHKSIQDELLVKRLRFYRDFGVKPAKKRFPGWNG